MNYPDFDGTQPCRQIDPEFFHPSCFSSISAQHRNMLINLCNDCHMREACLSWAIRHEDHGWWAGTTPTDRKYLRRQMGIRLETPMLPLADRRAA